MALKRHCIQTLAFFLTYWIQLLHILSLHPPLSNTYTDILSNIYTISNPPPSEVSKNKKRKVLTHIIPSKWPVDYCSDDKPRKELTNCFLTKESETRVTARIRKQDPDTYKIKNNATYYNKTQQANVRGNPFFHFFSHLIYISYMQDHIHAHNYTKTIILLNGVKSSKHK